MILLLLLNLTTLSGLEQLHKHFAVFNDLENDMKWKTLHRTHEQVAYESALLNEEFNVYRSKVTGKELIPQLLQSIDISPNYSQTEEYVGYYYRYGTYEFCDDPLKYFSTFLEENAFEPLGEYEFGVDVYDGHTGIGFLHEEGFSFKTKKMNFVVSAINKKTKVIILKRSLWGYLQYTILESYCPTSIDQFMVNKRLENILIMLVKNEIPSGVGNLLHKCVKSTFHALMAPGTKWKFKKLITYLLQNRDLDIEYLKSIADVNQMSSEEGQLCAQTSPFHSAINSHNADVISLMIENNNPDLMYYGKPMHQNCYDDDEIPETGVNIIHLALRANSSARMHPEKLMETLKVLLEALGDKRTVLLNDKIGGYVLNYAATNMPFCVVELLVESGADVLLANPNDLNPTEKYGFAFQNEISPKETVEIQDYLDLKIKRKVAFVPKSILKNPQVDDMKKIQSLKRVSFAEKNDYIERSGCKKEAQKEIQEECDSALSFGPGKAPEPAKIVPSKER